MGNIVSAKLNHVSSVYDFLSTNRNTGHSTRRVCLYLILITFKRVSQSYAYVNGLFYIIYRRVMLSSFVGGGSLATFQMVTL